MRCLQVSVIVLLTACGSALAQSSPFDGLDTRGRAYTDQALYEQSKAQWLARVQALPDNVDVLEGAADFFIIRERPLAENLFERARALEPKNPKWPSRLAQLHKLNAASGDLNEARLALVEMERAFALTPEKGRLLPSDLPQTAFEAEDMAKARGYAERLRDEAEANPKRWDYGNAVHKANLVLGRIALREGRVADAVQLLRASGKTTGSPQLGSFGPNMLLAKDLLEAGEKEAVLAYFELCRAFWTMGGERLDRWTKEVQAGLMPNFGPNLRY